jgi:hypothetical protein
VCSFSVSPSSVTVPAEARSGTIEVRASNASCTWTAGSAPSWIAIASGTTGAGNGRVDYEISENNGLAERTATLTVAGQPVTVTQAAKLLNLNLDGRVSALTGSCPAISFTLDDGQVVRTSLLTLFLGRSCAQLRNDMRVEVTGVRQLDGSILAVRVSAERD